MTKRTIAEQYGYPISPGDIGIEIEAEAGNPFPINKQIPGDWVATTDGSLRGNSIEYVSAFPVKYESVDMHLKGLKDAIEKYGVKIRQSFRAGVHVHINMRPYKLNEIANFAAVYFILEHALVRFCGDNREGNLFCLRLEDAEAPLFFLQEALRNDNYGVFETDNIRYASLNFRSLSRHGSLEFRAMETTPDLEKVGPWAKMLYQMREYAVRNPRNTYAEQISLLGPENWAEQIVGPELFKLIRYPSFNKDVMKSMRNVQTLLYIW